MPRPSSNHSLVFYNMNGKIKSDKELIEVFKAATVDQIKSLVLSISNKKIKTFLKKLYFLSDKLKRELALRNKNDDIEIDNLSLDQIYSFYVVIKEAIEFGTEKLQANKNKPTVKKGMNIRTGDDCSFYNVNGKIKSINDLLKIFEVAKDDKIIKMLSSVSTEELQELLNAFATIVDMLKQEAQLLKEHYEMGISCLPLEELSALFELITSVIKFIEKELDDAQKKDEMDETLRKIMSIIYSDKTPQPTTPPKIIHPKQLVSVKTNNNEAANIGDTTNNSEVANIGDTITIQYLDDLQETFKFTLVALSKDHNPGERKYWVNSPLGKAVYGHKVGDRCNWENDSGSFEVTIIRIEKKQILDGHVRVHKKNWQ